MTFEAVYYYRDHDNRLETYRALIIATSLTKAQKLARGLVGRDDRTERLVSVVAHPDM